jgi:hypothetical protein
MDEAPWTVSDGVRDVLRFLLRRSPLALALWLVFGGAALVWANTGAVAGGMGGFGMLIALVSTLAGYPVGMAMARGLLEAVRFTGWIPMILAATASITVLLLGWLALHAVLGVGDTHLGAIIVVTSSLGALGAVARHTWAES